MQATEPIIRPDHRAIKNWAREDQPREKLIIKGPEALSDAELLCLLIGKGSPRHNAMDLARQIIRITDSDLRTLAKYSVQDLLKLKLEGFGKAKAAAFVAAFELGCRRHAGRNAVKPVFKD